MLSKGNWHQCVPKNLRDNLKFRQELVRACARKPKYQAAIRAACRDDLLFYVNAFVWQYNPRKKESGSTPGPRIAPFISFPFQDDAFLVMLDHIDRGEDLLIQKSREMGASWMLLIVFKWLTDFHRANKFLCMSRNEEMVDADDEDSLFWKTEFMYRHEPGWLCGWPTEVRRRVKYFGNLRTSSSTTGTASTGKAGVGGRATAMGIDEYSQIKEDYEVLDRTSDTTDCRIFNGTHKGAGTAFYELSQRVDMAKLWMHWTDHPEKNDGLYKFNTETQQLEFYNKQKQRIPKPTFPFPEDYPFVTNGKPTGGPFPGFRSPWYDMQCKRKSSARAIAMDLDIDPAGSESQFFNDVTIRTLRETYGTQPYGTYKLFFDAKSGEPLRLQASEDGLVKLWTTPDGRGFLPPARYGAGCDVATGTGATPSCLSIINADTGEKVLEYADAQIEYPQFALFVVAMMRLCAGNRGESPMLAWEKLGVGTLFGKHVMQLGYTNVYYKTTERGIAAKTEVTDVPGFDPSELGAKRRLLEEYRQSLQARQIINRSDIALKECLQFAYDGRGDVEHTRYRNKNDPSGAGENHADIVIADALAWKMCLLMGLGKKEVKDDVEVQVLSLAWRRLQAEKMAIERSRY